MWFCDKKNFEEKKNVKIFFALLKPIPYVALFTRMLFGTFFLTRKNFPDALSVKIPCLFVFVALWNEGAAFFCSFQNFYPLIGMLVYTSVCHADCLIEKNNKNPANAEKP